MYEQLIAVLTPDRLLVAAAIGHWTGRLATSNHKPVRRWSLLVSLLFVGGIFAISSPAARTAGPYAGEHWLVLILLAVACNGCLAVLVVSVLGFGQLLTASPLFVGRWWHKKPARLAANGEQGQHQATPSSHLEQADKEQRTAIRQQLLLCYHRHCPQIQQAIDRKQYQEYCDVFLDESLPLEQVEANAQQMIETIRSVTDSDEAEPVEHKT